MEGPPESRASTCVKMRQAVLASRFINLFINLVFVLIEFAKDQDLALFAKRPLALAGPECRHLCCSRSGAGAGWRKLQSRFGEASVKAAASWSASLDIWEVLYGWPTSQLVGWCTLSSLDQMVSLPNSLSCFDWSSDSICQWLNLQRGGTKTHRSRFATGIVNKFM